MTGGTYSLFVACAPGLEALLAAELQGLEVSANSTAGGAEADVDAEGMYRVLLGCGLGLRVLLRVGSVQAVRFAQLERGLMELAWHTLLPRGVAVTIKATARKSRLYHSGAVAERVRNVLSSAIDARAAAAEDHGAAIVHARMDNDSCLLSLDLCGSPMQQRGYRLAGGKAPLREDIARALLMTAGYDGNTPLVDPLCGSGTLPIEAALLASKRAPGSKRAFALSTYPLHDAQAEERARAALGSHEGGQHGLPIVGGDRDRGGIKAATQNLERSGLADRVTFSCQPITATVLPPPTDRGGLIVCNPPYGKRISNAHALRDLYAAVGRLRRSAPAGYRLALVTSNGDLAQATRIPLRSMLMTDLGGLKVKFYVED